MDFKQGIVILKSLSRAGRCDPGCRFCSVCSSQWIQSLCICANRDVSTINLHFSACLLNLSGSIGCAGVTADSGGGGVSRVLSLLKLS